MEKFIERVLPRIIVSSNGDTEEFDVTRISKSLIREIKLDPDVVEELVKIITKRVIISKLKTITAPMLREIVCSVMIENGFEKERYYYTRLGMPYYDFEQLLKTDLAEKAKKDIIYNHLVKEYTDINKLIKSEVNK